MPNSLYDALRKRAIADQARKTLLQQLDDDWETDFLENVATWDIASDASSIVEVEQDGAGFHVTVECMYNPFDYKDGSYEVGVRVNHLGEIVDVIDSRV